MKIAVITVSDSVSLGEREDLSGPAVVARCEALGWQVAARFVVPDEQAKIQAYLLRLSDLDQFDLVLTTGGTGLGPRDVTPEATESIAQRLVPGFAEEMRRKGLESTPRAAMSRAIAAIRGNTLILNLPGSPKGAVQSLDAVAALLPHAIDVMRGARHD
ncbi:MAG TPA: MogA/MoaB family molybdenum cofactor biosynthesis protein [Dongiaceae bacterium]|nr:MogA/MoaB family molybdenum cofactor biosynthesis protein [Dongiaceae bacterium]